MKYSKNKLTLKKRSTIHVGAVVDLEVNEFVNVEGIYATFHIRKCLAKSGLIQLVSTPFPQGFCGLPTISVKNDSVSDIELREGDEIGELWCFHVE